MKILEMNGYKDRLVVESKKSLSLTEAPFNELLIVMSDTLKVNSTKENPSIISGELKRGSQLVKFSNEVAHSMGKDLRANETLVMIYKEVSGLMNYPDDSISNVDIALVVWDTSLNTDEDLIANMKELRFIEDGEIHPLIIAPTIVNGMFPIATLIGRPVYIKDILGLNEDVTYQVSLNLNKMEITITKLYRKLYEVAKVILPNVDIMLWTGTLALVAQFNAAMHSRMLEDRKYLDSYCAAMDLFYEECDTEEVEEEEDNEYTEQRNELKLSLFTNNLYRQLPQDYIAKFSISTPKMLIAYYTAVFGIDALKRLKEDSKLNNYAIDTTLELDSFVDKSIDASELFKV